MATVKQQAHVRRARPWWRPLAYSAATLAVIANLFQALPASAAPRVPVPPVAPPAAAVPDAGSRPALGPGSILRMPGAPTGTTTPVSTSTLSPGLALSPLMQKLETQRNEVTQIGDQLIVLGNERDLARDQVVAAGQKVSDTQAALLTAQDEAETAAAIAVRERAALPPGAVGSGLADLDALARMQRGETATEESAARRLAILQESLRAATAEQATATTNATDTTARYDQLKADLDKKQAALQKLEQDNATEIAAAEAAQSAVDAALGAEYLKGAKDGRGADKRALAAVKIALAQQGDPYIWATQGPKTFDCSGLMFYSYRSKEAGRYPLNRVSRDQYNQTSRKTVDRYSLLPGDLLFFSSSNSWRDIHHVAMYVGQGMMVEAPRARLKVRVVPVRWSRLFSATRIYGSVEGTTANPDLSGPKPTTEPTKEPTEEPTDNPTDEPAEEPTDNETTPPPGTTPPGTGQPGTGQPGTGQPGTEDPDTDPPVTDPPTTPAPTTPPPTTPNPGGSSAGGNASGDGNDAAQNGSPSGADPASPGSGG